MPNHSHHHDAPFLTLTYTILPTLDLARWTKKLAGEPKAGIRFIGAPGWNLERGHISNEEEGGKPIYFGIGPLNGGGPWI